MTCARCHTAGRTAVPLVVDAIVDRGPDEGRRFALGEALCLYCVALVRDVAPPAAAPATPPPTATHDARNDAARPRRGARR